MEVVYIIMLVLVLGVSIYSLISYLSNKGSFKKRQARVMSELEPARRLNADEQDAFEKIYKKRPVNEAPVYRLKGPLEYVGIKVQGVESKEFYIGGVRIASAAVVRLSKKDIGVNLEQTAERYDQEAIQEKLAVIRHKAEQEGVSEEEIAKRMQEKLENEMFHTAEVVFLSEDVGKKPAYLVRLDDWKLSPS